MCSHGFAAELCVFYGLSMGGWVRGPDRQTDRQADRQTDRQTDRHRHRQTQIQRYRDRERQRDGQRNRDRESLRRGDGEGEIGREWVGEWGGGGEGLPVQNRNGAQKPTILTTYYLRLASPPA